MSEAKFVDYGIIRERLRHERRQREYVDWNSPRRRALRVVRFALLAITAPLWAIPVGLYYAVVMVIAFICWLIKGDPEP